MNIRVKLTVLLLLIGLVPTLLVSTVAYVTIGRELRDTTAVQLESAAAKQEQRIGSQIRRRQEEMSQFVNQFNLQTTLAQYMAQPTDTDRSALDAVLLDRKVQSPDMQTIYLTDLQGEVIASTLDGTTGENIADKINVNSRNQYSVRIHEDDRDGLSRMYMTAAVTVNTERAALLTIVYRIDDIIAALQDYTGLGETGETMIAGRSDGNVVSQFPLRSGQAPAGTILNSMRIFDRLGETVTNVSDYRGANVVMSVRPISASDWALATKIDTSEAYAPIESLRNILLLIVVVSSLIIFVISLLIARYFTAPILSVARTARWIGEGDFGARVQVHRRDEIGLLSQSVNAMGESLGDLVARIEEQRARLEIILNNTTEGILAIDEQGNVLLANKAATQLAGQPADDMVGRHINDVFAWQQNGQPIAIYYDTPGIRSYPNLQYTSVDGTIHYLKLIIAKIQNADPRAKARAIVTVHDETKSHELDDMKIDFVSMAAHELRTPLASLRGYLELVDFKEGQNISPESQQHIKQALKSTADLGGLINNLLDVTRIERGALVVTPEKIDLAEISRQAVEDMRFSADEKHLSLTYTGLAESCYVYADAIAIREVLNNLLTNAIKYTGEGGKITVNLQRDGDMCVVSVNDTGIGIPARAQDHLFTKFYRVKGGLDSGSNGTGLGLYIAKSILERHHGTIKVTSEEGVGSTFTFRLPRYEVAGKAEGQPNAETNPESIRRRRGWITKNITR